MMGDGVARQDMPAAAMHDTVMSEVDRDGVIREAGGAMSGLLNANRDR